MSFFSQFFKKKESDLKILSIKDFGLQITTTLEQELSDYQYKIIDNDEKTYILIMNGENERARFLLDRHYHDYLKGSSDNERTKILTDISQNLLASLNKFEQKTLTLDGKIMPVIKPYSWLQQYADAEGKSFTDCSLFAAPLAFQGTGDLCILFAIDRGEDVIFANKAFFPDAETNDLFIEANQNIHEYFIEQLKAESLQISEHSIGYFIKMDGNYEASLVFVMPLITGHLIEITGDPVFVLLARDMLIIADSNNKEQIAELKKAAEDSFPELDYALSPTLYTYKEGIIYVFED